MPIKTRLKLEGQRFGWLMVLEDLPTNSKDGGSEVLCECACGKRFIMQGRHIKGISSCGCKRVLKGKQRVGRCWSDKGPLK